MTPRRDQLIDEYLRRLDNAAVFLSAERRAELRQEIVEHIDAGLEEADAKHAEAVRAVLDRLGPPADIVAAETGGGPRSTGSTSVVEPAHGSAHESGPGSAHEFAHQSAHKSAHESVLPPLSEVTSLSEPPAFAPVPAPSPAPSPSRRGRTVALIGAGAAVFAFGALFLGFAVSTEGSSPSVEAPATTATPNAPTVPTTTTPEPGVDDTPTPDRS